MGYRSLIFKQPHLRREDVKQYDTWTVKNNLHVEKLIVSYPLFNIFWGQESDYVIMDWREVSFQIYDSILN